MDCLRVHHQKETAQIQNSQKEPQPIWVRTNLKKKLCHMECTMFYAVADLSKIESAIDTAFLVMSFSLFCASYLILLCLDFMAF